MIWLFFLSCSTSPSSPALISTATPLGSPEKTDNPPPSACPNKLNQQPMPSDISSVDPRLTEKQLIVINKSKRWIGLYKNGELTSKNCWPIGLGPTPKGHKQKEGDGKTPEGWYKTSDKPSSTYYGAIAIHYPNAKDTQKALIEKRISQPLAKTVLRRLKRGKKPPQATPLGGEILIHGGGSQGDWTLGCIAMNNPQLDSLRSQLPDKKRSTVLILP